MQQQILREFLLCTWAMWQGNGYSLIDDGGKGKEVLIGYCSSKLYKLNVQTRGTLDLLQTQAFMINLESTSNACKT